MKKVIAVVLAVVCVLSLAACGSKPAATTTTPASTTTAKPADGTTTAAPSADFKWPTQPVNVVCPAAAGGGTDNILRVINDYFIKKTGQSFVIQNSSASSGYEITRQAVADGYNFICGTTTIFVSKLEGSLDYDYEDFEIVTYQDSEPTLCIAVNAKSKYQNFSDLVNAAKADPKSVTGGIVMTGHPYYFASSLNAYMKENQGFEFYYADAGTTAERHAALLGNQYDFIITNYGACYSYVQSGDFRIVAMDGDTRYSQAPDVPTFKEQGYDYKFFAQPMIWLAPKGTSAEACEAFNKILNEIYGDAEFQEKMLKSFASKVDASAIMSVADSIVAAKNFKDALAPYVD